MLTVVPPLADCWAVERDVFSCRVLVCWAVPWLVLLCWLEVCCAPPCWVELWLDEFCWLVLRPP